MVEYDENCTFCRIARKEIGSTIIYSNQYAIAFRDINPVSKGHTLVIPVNHYADISEIPLEILDKTIEAAEIVTGMLKVEDYEIAGFNLLNCSGKESGQSVYHFHIHVIPRRNRDAESVVPKIEALLIPK